MVAGGEDGIQADGRVEVRPGAADVAEVVFGDAPVKEGPVVGGIDLGKDVEMRDGLGQTSFCQGVTAPEHEDVLVILSTRGKREAQDCKHADEQFPSVLHPEKFSNHG